MTEQTPPRRAPAAQPRQRKQTLLRLDPAVHDALARWAADELRSTNAQIEFLLRRALAEAGRLPGSVRPIARRGRPPKQAPEGPGTPESGGSTRPHEPSEAPGSPESPEPGESAPPHVPPEAGEAIPPHEASEALESPEAPGSPEPPGGPPGSG
ncbi:hypothetical protein [Streptomyces californicus]|uniref:hypothetical protein n=1 Tax=Streptomyces californicus TaxID=67351 RepID=UPI00296EEBB1|nr:hypothetical protein [Streptomyces californicus]MDW4913520.1 hypothetical protein [Streptomyces californicus]